MTITLFLDLLPPKLTLYLNFLYTVQLAHAVILPPTKPTTKPNNRTHSIAQIYDTSIITFV